MSVANVALGSRQSFIRKAPTGRHIICQHRLRRPIWDDYLGVRGATTYLLAGSNAHAYRSAKRHGTRANNTFIVVVLAENQRDSWSTYGRGINLGIPFPRRLCVGFVALDFGEIHDNR